MSEFESFKKSDLVSLIKKAGYHVRSKDTKLNLLEILDTIRKEDPSIYAGLLESVAADDADDADALTLVEAADATDDEIKETEVVEEIEIVDGEESSEDKKYNAPPPIDLQEYLVDPVAAAIKNIFGKYFIFDELNDDLRLYFSSVQNLAKLELGTELFYFLYLFVPLVKVQKNNFLPQLLKDNMSFVEKFPDFSVLIKPDISSVLVQWALFSILVPAAISYYINFTRRVVVLESDDDADEDYEFEETYEPVDTEDVEEEEAEEEEDEEEEEEEEDDDDEDEVIDFGEEKDDLTFVVRMHDYDPIIFVLAKIVIFYFIINNRALAPIDSYEGVYHILKKFVGNHYGFYQDYATELGSFPLVIGAATVVIGLYSHFEDF